MPNTTSVATPPVPDYLRDTYTWAYLDHRTVPWLDQPVVVSAILWGNASRLMNAAVREFSAGQRVLQGNRSLSGVLLPAMLTRNNRPPVQSGGTRSDQSDGKQQQVAAA